MAMDTQLEKRKAQWRQCFSMQGESKRLYLVHWQDNSLTRPQPHPDQYDLRLEWAVAKYESLVNQMEWLDDHKLPFLDVFTGTEIFAEAFGCSVHRSAENMPFALPCVHSAAEAAKLRVPDVAATPLADLFNLADRLRERTDNQALVRLPDIQSPIDIAALIWDKNDFYPAMLTAPEAVLELTGKVQELLTAFLDEWFARYGTEYIAHFPDYFMDSGMTLSEDEIGALSSEMFRQFSLPNLEALSARYGGLGIHCCANAQHQWELLQQIPDLRLLNLVQPPEVLLEAYEFFADTVVQMHAWAGDGDPRTWVQNLPARARVVLQAEAETKDEAKRLVDAFRELE